ncbi:hypothetical protein [Streptosporangium sp. NPDC023615]|uniref:hypothetical protein n=1 Tax=Streptosporangium sp. NPDC023615 TaxID=3154794 RepID=UPI003442473B
MRRFPASPARPHRPVETRADRALRLALARDPLARRREGDTPMSGRGGVLPSHANAAAPSTTVRDEARRFAALRRAEELTVALARHGISADVHELASGRAAVSVYYGLVACTDDEEFRWTSPELSRRGGPGPVSETTTVRAVERLVHDHRILRARQLTDVLGSELPLLADVIVAGHVVPR